jgi:hypothetical protein
MSRLLDDDPLDLLGLPQLPPGWRPEDVIGASRRARFLTVAEASRVMALPEEDVLEMVEAGLLETIEDELGRLLVEPAIVRGGRMVDVDERTPRRA